MYITINNVYNGVHQTYDRWLKPLVNGCYNNVCLELYNCILVHHHWGHILSYDMHRKAMHFLVKIKII